MGDRACVVVTLGCCRPDGGVVCGWPGKQTAPRLSLLPLVCEIRGACSCMEGSSEGPNERRSLNVPIACQVLWERQPSSR